MVLGTSGLNFSFLVIFRVRSQFYLSVTLAILSNFHVDLFNFRPFSSMSPILLTSFLTSFIALLGHTFFPFEDCIKWWNSERVRYHLRDCELLKYHNFTFQMLIFDINILMIDSAFGLLLLPLIFVVGCNIFCSNTLISVKLAFNIFKCVSSLWLLQLSSLFGDDLASSTKHTQQITATF